MCSECSLNAKFSLSNDGRHPMSMVGSAWHGKPWSLSKCSPFLSRLSNLSTSDSVLVVICVPLQYFKEIIPRKVHKVEELTTHYLPPLEEGTEPGNIFYSVGRHEEENRDWCYRFDDSEKLFPTRLPKFNTRGIQGMLQKQASGMEGIRVHYERRVWLRIRVSDSSGENISGRKLAKRSCARRPVN
ncbi:hypothetical protein M5K25_003822 [Dendrobium thyrsiflorum]|uniref:Uncharacterized protein n=1 Tax=Dendrobium thyrsiflorum TaxID=117978 RepID=A0ABD0VL73_DENTH